MTTKPEEEGQTPIMLDGRSLAEDVRELVAGINSIVVICADDVDLSCIMFEGIGVRCSHCGGKFHELTAKFRPEPPMRGSYLKLNKRYGPGGYGWYDFPHNDSVVGDNVQCPRCAGPYRMASILKQVRAYVKELQGRETGQVDEAATDNAGHPEEEAPRGEDGGNLDDLGPADEPEAIGDMGEVCSFGNDDAGIFALRDAGDSIPAQVRRMTATSTQAEIAQTLQISIYRVRQIQIGKEV